MGPRLAGLGAVAALSWFVAACGDQDAGTIFPGQDTFADAVADTSPSDTTADASADTSSPDTSADVGPGDTREPPDTVAPLTGFKDDGRFIVPGQIAKKTWPAVAGSLVAWVEGTDAGPVLVVWDTQVLTNPPRVYLVQNLVNPRELTLSDAFLAYVDDRYGDPDVFALDLETGVERAVVTRPGAQEKPSIIGSRVAWEDCRDCVTGGGVPGRESQRQVVERDLAGGAERIVASGAGGAFAPRYGLLDRKSVV